MNIPFDSIFLRAVVAAALMYGLRSMTYRAAQRDMEPVTRALRDTIVLLRAEERTAVDHMKRALAESPSAIALSGRDPAANKLVALSATDIDVLYLLQTQCAACAVNLPALNQAYKRGVKIVGVSHEDGERDIVAYRSKHGIEFPVLIRLGGPYFRVLKSDLTPMTVRFNRGTPVDVLLGRLPNDFGI